MKVHHIEISCVELEKARKTFTEEYLFTDFGRMINSYDENVYVMMTQQIYIILRQSKQNIDTIDNVVFCVDSVEEFCNHVIKHGGEVVEKLTVINCDNKPFAIGHFENSYSCSCHVTPCENYITRAVVKSSIGNVKHTLINKDHYKGLFLPGFEPNHVEIEPCESSIMSRIDHIAFVVECGSLSHHITWYQNCLKMTRFMSCDTEEESGLVVQNSQGIGVRMLTLQGELETRPKPVRLNINSVDPIQRSASEKVGNCDDSLFPQGNYRNKTGGDYSGKEVELALQSDSVKFVFLESLRNNVKDHMQSFLDNHQGPGIQHIAFHTDNIINTTRQLLKNGVTFVKPPTLYYDVIEKTLLRLQREEIDISALQNCGILIDAEGEGDGGLLYQIFTEHVFNSNTFFFELVQRNMADGFGAGNVNALWKALETKFQETSLD